MTAYTVTYSFVKQLSERVRALAIPELFGGTNNKAAIKGKLALGYSIPLNWNVPENHKFELRLVARASVKCKDDKYHPYTFKVNTYFTRDTIISGGPGAWPMTIEAMAYQLVRALKSSIQERGSTYKMISIYERQGLDDNMQRIEV